MALSGVVVNDSLVMVHFMNRKIKEGMQLGEAVRLAGVRRFRPIMLTSATTFFGLGPLMFEDSPQAAFLVPMAISLAWWHPLRHHHYPGADPSAGSDFQRPQAIFLQAL